MRPGCWQEERMHGPGGRRYGWGLCLRGCSGRTVASSRTCARSRGHGSHLPHPTRWLTVAEARRGRKRLRERTRVDYRRAGAAVDRPTVVRGALMSLQAEDPRRRGPFGCAGAGFESRLPRDCPSGTAGGAPSRTGRAPGAGSLIEGHSQALRLAMTGASTTISTSSAESRENARQPATSAALSNVPRSSPVAIAMTV